MQPTAPYNRVARSWAAGTRPVAPFNSVEWKTEQRFQVSHTRISWLKKSFFFLNELAYVLIVLLVGTCCTLILFLYCSCQANLDYSWWYGKTLTDFFFLLSILLLPFTRSNMQSALFDPSPFMEQWLFQRWTLSKPCKVIGEWQVALSIKYQ